MVKKVLLMAVCVSFAFMFTISSDISVFAAGKAIEITVGDPNPGQSTVAQAWDAWGKWIEEQGNGKIKVNIHHGGVLLKGAETYRGTQQRIVDAAHYVVNNQDGFVLNTVMALPFMGLPDQQKSGRIYKALLEKFPEMRAEWKKVKIMGMMFMPPTFIHTTKKPIKTPKDLKGLKMHGAEAVLVQSMAAFGATAVNIGIEDMYISAERGLIDGVMNHFPVLAVFGVLEILPYHTIFGDGGINMTPMTNIMNADRYNGLPPDIKKIFDEGMDVWADKMWEFDQIMQKGALKTCEEGNHTFINLTPEQIAEWRNLVKGPIHDKWIAGAESQGLPGKAVYEEALRLIAENR